MVRRTDGGPASGRKRNRTVAAIRRIVMLFAGAVLLAVVIYTGYLSHERFKESLTGNFNIQQGVLAKSLESSILAQIREGAKHLLHVVR